MATFKFSCPHCGQRIEVEDEYSGQTSPCPTCHVDFVIPALPDVTKNFSCKIGVEPDLHDSANYDSNFLLNGKQCSSFNEINEELKLCQQYSINRVTLSNGNDNFLSVMRENDRYQLEWMIDKEIWISVSRSLTFKKVVKLFEEYYTKNTSLKIIIHWKRLDGNISNRTCLKDVYGAPIGITVNKINCPYCHKRIEEKHIDGDAVICSSCNNKFIWINKDNVFSDFFYCTFCGRPFF